MTHMSSLRWDDRRESPRLPARLYVRGLGDDRRLAERLGDVALGGVGFEVPRAPDTDLFQVRFTCPGEDRLRTGMAKVIDLTPMTGTLDRDGAFFAHLRFTQLQEADERAIARSLDALAQERRVALAKAQHALTRSRRFETIPAMPAAQLAGRLGPKPRTTSIAPKPHWLTRLLGNAFARKPS